MRKPARGRCIRRDNSDIHAVRSFWRITRELGKHATNQITKLYLRRPTYVSQVSVIHDKRPPPLGMNDGPLSHPHREDPPMSTATLSDHAFTPRNGLAADKAKSRFKDLLIGVFGATLIFFAGVNHGHNDVVAKNIASHSATTPTTVAASAPGK